MVGGWVKGEVVCVFFGGGRGRGGGHESHVAGNSPRQGQPQASCSAAAALGKGRRDSAWTATAELRHMAGGEGRAFPHAMHTFERLSAVRSLSLIRCWMAALPMRWFCGQGAGQAEWCVLGSTGTLSAYVHLVACQSVPSSAWALLPLPCPNLRQRRCSPAPAPRRGAAAWRGLPGWPPQRPSRRRRTPPGGAGWSARCGRGHNR